MIESLLTASATAIWLGFLTSISPCPLATNIAAISYIGRTVESPRAALWRGLFYTVGRMLSYVAISAILVTAVLAVPEIALFLQHEMNAVLGPLLVVVGLILLQVVRLPALSSGSLASRMQGRFERFGLLGAVLLGIVFALSFCPVSAALYFGSLIPLSLERGSPVLLPMLYGAGTAIPVVAFALLIAFSAHLVGRAYDALATFEKWARPITGVVFLLVGIYFVWEYIVV